MTDEGSADQSNQYSREQWFKTIRGKDFEAHRLVLSVCEQNHLTFSNDYLHKDCTCWRSFP